jgi:hypothetical protein
VTEGRVRVVVQPWGEVWVGEKYMGRAPLTLHLSKGQHVIEAGHERPTQTRDVNVEAGTRQEIEFVLTE